MKNRMPPDNGAFGGNLGHHFHPQLLIHVRHTSAYVRRQQLCDLAQSTSVGYEGATTSDPILAKWETTSLTSKIVLQEGA